MPPQSIQELEILREATLKQVDDIDVEIENAESSATAASLKELRNAYLDLVLAVERRIVGKMEMAIRGEDLALVEKVHEATMDMVASEQRLLVFQDGLSFTQRWDIWKVAEALWFSAFDAVQKHRSTYSTILTYR